MQIVIDIPEDVYTRLFDNGIQDNEIAVDDVCEMAMAIRKGASLPKGHGRLIEDTPELERELWAYTRYTGIDEAPYEFAVKVIDEAPTIIAACTLAEADGGDAK